MLATLLKSKDILKNPLRELSTYLNGLKIQTVSRTNSIITKSLFITDLNVSNSKWHVRSLELQAKLCIITLIRCTHANGKLCHSQTSLTANAFKSSTPGLLVRGQTRVSERPKDNHMLR